MSDDTRALAATRATELAHGLRDPEAVTTAISTRAAHTLCYGLAGTALLHACLGDATTAATHWNAASRALGNAPPDGIHTGPGALATSLIIGTPYLPEPGSHHDLVPRATTWLSARAQALAHHQHTSPHPWTPWAIYDAIKGLSGIGRILLAAHTTGHQTQAAPGLNAALTTLTTMILTDQGTRPGWWLPPPPHPQTGTNPPPAPPPPARAPGNAGPLAFLSLAHLAGHTVPGQPDAIAKAADWLLTWSDPGPTWPPYIPGTDLDTGPTSTPSTTPGRRTAWCYGTPGIATALTHAAKAINDPALLETAAAALSHLAPNPTTWDTEGPGLCHGAAGILQTTAHHRHHNAAAHDLLAETASVSGFLNGTGGLTLALADHAGILTHPSFASWHSLLLLR